MLATNVVFIVLKENQKEITKVSGRVSWYFPLFFLHFPRHCYRSYCLLAASQSPIIGSDPPSELGPLNGWPRVSWSVRKAIGTLGRCPHLLTLAASPPSRPPAPPLNPLPILSLCLLLGIESSLEASTGTGS